MSSFSYKDNNSFSKRSEEATRVINKYPGKIPIICEKQIKFFDGKPVQEKRIKYLVASTHTIGEFIFFLKSKIGIKKEQSIFLFIDNNMIPRSSETLGELYNKYKDDDKFLYIKYCYENTFG